jgi:molybdopterin synthase catalytic subunit
MAENQFFLRLSILIQQKKQRYNQLPTAKPGVSPGKTTSGRSRMIEVTGKQISPEAIIAKAKTRGSGCVVTYVGLIRDTSHDKPVLSVEYEDSKGNAETVLQEIAHDAKQKWQVENIAISHRANRLMVGEINLVVAVASAHRSDGLAACQYIVDRFKERLPTRKTETYQDGSILREEAH